MKETRYKELNSIFMKQYSNIFKKFTSKSIIILTDNQIIFDISENPANYRQAKYIDIYYHAIKYYIHDKKIKIDYISSNYQLADIFIKALGQSKHHKFCQMMGFTLQF